MKSSLPKRGGTPRLSQKGEVKITCLAAATYLMLIFTPALLSYGQSGSDQTFTFGDSLSDVGNFYFDTGDFVLAPYQPVPDAPYAVGGHYFSNGSPWIAQLATRLHQPMSGEPALQAPGIFTNYAFGRARARAAAPNFPSYDLSTQVQTFLDDYGGEAPGDALYVLWIGSNDVQDALLELNNDPTGATSNAIIEEAVLTIGANIMALHDAGARNFLVLNVPNLAITPAVLALGQVDPLIPFLAELLSAGFNQGLSDILDFLGAVLQDVQIQRLDAFQLLNDIASDPASFGFEDVVTPCLTFGVAGGAICPQPDQNLFWDASHPTRAGHAVVAETAYQLLHGP